MGKIIKKANYCSRCVFLDSNDFCRVGLGWKKIHRPENSYCSGQQPISILRCGTCRWFRLKPDKREGYCYLDNEYMNWYDYCKGYIYESGKNLKPIEQPPPKKLKRETLKIINDDH